MMKRLTIIAVLMLAATAAHGQSAGSYSSQERWPWDWTNRTSRAWANAWSGTQPTREYHRGLHEARNPTVTVHRLHQPIIKEANPNRGTNERSRLTRTPSWRRDGTAKAVFFTPK